MFELPTLLAQCVGCSVVPLAASIVGTASNLQTPPCDLTRTLPSWTGTDPTSGISVYLTINNVSFDPTCGDYVYWDLVVFDSCFNQLFEAVKTDGSEPEGAYTYICGSCQCPDVGIGANPPCT